MAPTGETSSKKRKAFVEEAPVKKCKTKSTGPGTLKGGVVTKKGKILTPKQVKRRQVTTLYSELIRPEREEAGSKMVGQILELLASRSTPLQQYCTSETGSRIMQACLKWGSNEQRRTVLLRLKEHLGKLALDRYGFVVVLKLLRYCTRTAATRKPTAEEAKVKAQNLRDFLDAFRGKAIHHAFFHKYGCRVLNGIYFSDAINSKEKRHLLHEVAVPRVFALTHPEIVNQPLRQLLAAESVSKEQRDAMRSHLAEVVEKVVDKELLGVDLVHVVLQAHCEMASEAQLKELAEKCMGGAPLLLSSKPGAEAVLRLLGAANAKQRKAFCKDLKGKFVALATNAVDYTVTMRLLATVDDTVMLEKSMLQELIPDLRAICFDKYGHKVLAWLFVPDDSRIFSPYERKCVALSAPTAVKAPEKRRQELLRALKPSVCHELESSALKMASDVYAKNILVSYLSAGWDSEIVDALVKAAETEAAADDMGLLGSGTTTSTLIALLNIEPEGERAAGLAPLLWHRCFEARVASAATSRCAFVLIAILRRGCVTGEGVRTALTKRRAEVETAVKAAEATGANTHGSRVLFAALDGKNPGDEQPRVKTHFSKARRKGGRSGEADKPA